MKLHGAATFLIKFLILPLIVLVVGSIIIGEGRFAAFNPTPIQWLSLGFAGVLVLALSALIATKWESLLKWLVGTARATISWVASNWTLLAAIALIGFALFAFYVATGSTVALAAAAALALGTVL